MSVSKDDLIRSFSNGALPDGSDFANLINFFTPEAEFKKHEAAFEAWQRRPDVTLGAADTGWCMALYDGHVWLAPNDHAPKPPPTPGGPPAQVVPDVALWGWVGMAGRVGTVIGADTFAKPGSELAPRLPEALTLPSDGTFRTILAPPGRPCAFELVAATDLPPAGKRGLWQRLLRAIGFGAPDNAVLHAVITANGAAGRPTLSLSGDPDGSVGWGRVALGLLLVAGLLSALGAHISVPGGIRDLGDLLASLKGAFAGIEKMVAKLLALLKGEGGQTLTLGSEPLGGWVRDGLFGGAILAALVFLNRRRHRARSAITLRWMRSTGSALTGTARYELQLRGPDLSERSGEGRLYFHITGLWG